VLKNRPNPDTPNCPGHLSTHVTHFGRFPGHLSTDGLRVGWCGRWHARTGLRFSEAGNTITRWTEFDRGGHFAAMETPDLLVDDIRAFFRALR
jgi:hypothetical protein